MRLIFALLLGGFTLFVACQDSPKETAAPTEDPKTEAAQANKVAYDKVKTILDRMAPQIDSITQISNSLNVQGRSLTSDEMNRLQDIKNFIGRLDIIRSRFRSFEEMENMKTTVSTYSTYAAQLGNLEKDLKTLIIRLGAQ